MDMLLIHYFSAHSLPLKQADSNFIESLTYLTSPQYNKSNSNSVVTLSVNNGSDNCTRELHFLY